MKTTYTVIVGNIGNVYSGTDRQLAESAFSQWRAAGEPVAIFGAGALIKEHTGKPETIKSVDNQLTECLPDWTKLVASLIPQIENDYRSASSAMDVLIDESDEIPAMDLTIGFTPESEDKDYSWSYQTGDNSYSGGAYSHPHWAVVTICRDSVPSEVADEIADQIGELVSQ